MDQFQQKFIEEATENLNELEASLLKLENHPDDNELLEQVFRALHTIKGGGAMFGFENISELTHNLENIYDYLRSGKAKLSNDLLTTTLAVVDHVKNLLNDPDLQNEDNLDMQQKLLSKIEQLTKSFDENNLNQEIKPVQHEGTAEKNMSTYYILFQPHEDVLINGNNPLYLIDELFDMGKCLVYAHLNKIPDIREIQPKKCYTYWEIFLATSGDINEISDIFLFVEEESTLEIHQVRPYNLLENKVFSEALHHLSKNDNDIGINQVEDVIKSIEDNTHKKTRNNGQANGKDNTIQSIRVDSKKLDTMMNLVSELVTTQARLLLYAQQQDNSELTEISESVQKLSRQLRDNAFSIVLIPIETVITRFNRLVRDLSLELKKEVSFTTEGTETELDKTIIESLTDPLLHIIRNSLDHGIETPEQRKTAGKPEKGNIHLKAFYSGADVIIQIQDDGAGIDAEKIRKKAIDREIISPETTMSQKDLLNLLFLPGFSTAEKISDVSGRGVGMDVVKRKIHEIRGAVEISSVKGQGTTISVKLPLTLSIIDGLLVTISDSNYIIPLSIIDKIHAIEHPTIANSFNNLVVLDDEKLPFYYLRNEFNCPDNAPEMENIILVKYEDKRVGLVVDHVIGEYQAVLKPLGKYYKNQDEISGASILGDGTVALVMDTNKLINKLIEKHQNLEEVKNE